MALGLITYYETSASGAEAPKKAERRTLVLKLEDWKVINLS